MRVDSASRGGGEHVRQLIVWAGALGVLLGIVYPLFSGRVWIDTDLGSIHLPVRQFYAEMLATGGRFTWFPYQFSGFYLHGEGQNGLLHPLNLVSYRLLPLEVAFHLEIVRGYVLLLAGSYWLGRRWTLPRDAASVFAFLFAFSGFNFLHFMHPNIVLSVAHLPFALVAIDAVLRPRHDREAVIGVVALTLLTASQHMLGHPHSTWLCLVTEGLYVFYLMLRGAPARALPWLLAAQGLAFAVAGIAVLPQAEALLASTRGLGVEGYAYSLSLHPVNLIQLVSPLFFEGRSVGDAEVTEFPVYAGAALPVLLAWLFVRRGQLAAAGVALRAALAVALFALLMALGAAGGIYWIQTLLPFVGQFRAPARYLLLFHGAAAFVAAVAIADLSRQLASRQGTAAAIRRPLYIVVAISILTTGALALAITAWPSLSFSDQLSTPGRIWLGPVLVAVAAGLVAWTARGSRVAMILLLGFMVVDHAAFGLSFLWRSQPIDVERFVGSAELPEWVDRYRMHYGPFMLTMRKVRFAGGYVALPPERRLDTHVYRVDGEPTAALITSLRAASVRLAHGRIVPDPMPRARLVAHAEVIHDLRQQMATVDLPTTALVDAALNLGAGPAGRVHIDADRPGDITLSAHAPSSQLLVLAESHHPGWRVTVDGAAAEVVAVYGDFLGCVVPIGRHEIRFQFQPSSMARGAWISGCGLAATAALGVAARRFGPRSEAA